MFHVPNKFRIRNHPILVSTDEDGNNGAFHILNSNGRELWVIASDGSGWEHVSVHINDGKRNLTPRWDEMCKIKDLFWDEEDVVVQFHPKKSEYVNNHPNTLHLWRAIDLDFPYPNSILVGIK